MKYAKLILGKDGSLLWTANYADGGKDLAQALIQIQRFQSTSGLALKNRQQKALAHFLELNAAQGYKTREQAAYGRRVKSRPPIVAYKKRIRDCVIDFFTYRDTTSK